MNRVSGLVIVAAGLVLGLSLANASSVKPPIRKADTKAAFAIQVASIRQQMQTGGRYQYVDPTERATVNTKLAEMSTLFDRFGSVAKMNEDSRVRLYNYQEKVNGILTHNDVNREICQRVVPIGSHIPKTYCRTYGQIMRERRGTVKAMQDLDSKGRVQDAQRLNNGGG